MNASIAPEKQSSFYLGFLFLGSAQRTALEAVYRFCRLVDDAADEGDAPVAQRRAELARWREEVEFLYQGRPVHPVMRTLAPYVGEFALPRAAFLEVIRGCETDLDEARFPDFAALRGYMDGVASAVGVLCVHIFGYTDPATLEYARWMGYAVQMTNILRDVPKDYAAGRVYLPLEDLERFGVSESDLRDGGPVVHDLMAFEGERAQAFYNKAREALSSYDRRSLLAAEIMAGVYEALLQRMRRSGYNVWSRRPRPSRWDKVRAVARAFRRCYAAGR